MPTPPASGGRGRAGADDDPAATRRKAAALRRQRGPRRRRTALRCHGRDRDRGRRAGRPHHAQCGRSRLRHGRPAAAAGRRADRAAPDRPRCPGADRQLRLRPADRRRQLPARDRLSRRDRQAGGGLFRARLRDRRPARSARSTPSSRTPTRVASCRRGTSPPTRRPSRSRRRCRPDRWRSATCRSRPRRPQHRACSASVSRRRRGCRPISSSSPSASSSASLRGAGATEVGVVTRAGVVAQASFALAASQALLAEYNRYFELPYPLPKLDNVAGPGSSPSLWRDGELGRDLHLRAHPAARSRSSRARATGNASSASRRTRSRTSGSATSSPCAGGTTSGSTRASPPGWVTGRRRRCIRSGTWSRTALTRAISPSGSMPWRRRTRSCNRSTPSSRRTRRSTRSPTRRARR